MDGAREELFVNDLAKGVAFWRVENRMGELMEFLGYYTRHANSNQYYRSVLVSNPGSTFMDIITASDIAYTITLVKNGELVWLQ